MALRKYESIILLLILVSFVLGIFYYPKMPDKMASHWNELGQVDGYMTKFWGLFLMPFVSISLLLLFIIIPKIDPLKVNIEKFRGYYNRFMVLLIVFFSYIHLLTIAWNLGFRFNLLQFLIPALAFLFYYTGILVENAKRNWFVGIRTPCTLSNEKVWDKTHKIGGKLFKITGIIALLGIFFVDYAIFFIIIPVLGVAVYSIIYSYMEYQKVNKK
ncbi:MAG: SdpI family protein [Candidatus Bathyarchaeota archaeon]|nr:SdpI family protein [Candidatus Bathyarchaeota archaeon]